MAPKLRNKYQRTTTPADGLDKEDPLDLETLNSEPKGKSKSNKLRLQERLEREKLLQQHRLTQQENLKKQHERENVSRKPATAENHQLVQNKQHVEGSSGTETITEPLLENHRTEHKTENHGKDTTENHERVKTENHAKDKTEDHKNTKTEDHESPVESSIVHDGRSLAPNDHGALGDSKLGDSKSHRRRCTNCCGRIQVQGAQKHGCLKKIEKLNDGNPTGKGVDQCGLECVNGPCPVEIKARKEKHDSRTSRGEEKAQIDSKKATSFHHREVDATAKSELSESRTSSFQQQLNFENESEMRLRGGCGGGCGGGGGGGGGTRNSACCPCGGCGGAACTPSTNCGNKAPSGCCGENQSRGLPCRCVCRSCSNPCPPCGTCGGQNCGKWNSCAGSGGGKCCFPRNTRRQNGAGCCGGGTGGCGGCC